jgi:hypothetical protein
MDPQSSFRSMTQDFPGVEIDIGGKGDYMSKADAKIRRIKDTYRKVKLGLPWKLPVVLVKDLVAYAVSHLNICRTTSLNENVCPRVLFTGVPVDYKKELLLLFGDYVEAYEGMDNTSKARSSACIALHPASNAAGSWILWKIETRSRVQRSNVKKMVTTDMIIQAMNSIADESRLEESEEVEEVVRQQPAENSVEIREITKEAEETPSRDPVEILPSVEAEIEQDAEEEKVEPDVAEAGEPVVTTRSGRSVIRPSRFVQVTKVSREDWKTEASTIVIKAELKMLFEDLKALRCIRRAEIKAGTKILKSHMFLVEKYLANGEFDKMKARLVADGRDQDAAMYPDKSSPTIAIHSVFTALGLVSGKPWRIVIKIDIKGAFVKTPMKGEPVYMRVDPKTSRYVIEMFPRLKEMLESDGCLYTLLLKAMYGCVQASALWYALIRGFVEELGYKCSPTDRCVFRKRVGGRVFVLLLYVDDILAQVDEAEVVRLQEHLMRKFGEVQFEVGSKLSYLGMQIDIKDEGTMVDMSFYVKKLLEGASVKGQSLPGNHNSFIVNEHAQKLEESEKKYFHSTTAKLLYLAKRARPDILTVVIFLCTRVQDATVQDRDKLDRVLGYLQWTEDYVLVLRPYVAGKITVYVDAAYALHSDSKSHTGVVIYAGETLVYVSSKKQKCMSKSPTEAELIALTDNLGLIELFHKFLEFLMMKKIDTLTIYQDCNAVVLLVTKGGGQTRTKNLRARMNLGKEMVDEKRAEVKHIRAEKMEADGFSKPYDPAEHKKFAAKLVVRVNGDNGWALSKS